MTDQRPEFEPTTRPIEPISDSASPDDDRYFTGDPVVDGILEGKRAMRRDNPLSLERDEWTGDPATDRKRLVSRALEVAHRPAPRPEDRDPIAEWHAQRLRNFEEAQARAARERKAAMPQSESRLRKWGTRLIAFFRQGAE